MRQLTVMDAVNRLDLEAAWREAWDQATEGAATFKEQLTALWRADRELNAGGSLNSISRNANSHSFANPSQATRSTVEMERLRLAALRLYEDIQAAKSLDDSPAAEGIIYNQGLAQFRIDPSEATADFSHRPCAA